MGTSHHEFRLGLLPDHKMNWRTLVTSYSVEIFLILIVVNLGLLLPQRLELERHYHITELIAIPSPQPKRYKAKPPVLHAKLLPPAPMTAPRLTVPREVRAPRSHQTDLEPPPRVVVNTFAPAVLKIVPGGARPMLVHTGEFVGSSVVPRVNAPVHKVQTGGFGDPNGIQGKGKSNPRLVVSDAGAFEMPQGAGYGNGSGGAKGIRGTVASADFGNGIASAGNGDGRSNGRGSGVQSAGFSQQEITPGAIKTQRQIETSPATNPVEITFKPNPVYTTEARQLKLEGEVLLEVTFAANGQLQVNRVVHGLGHGLDEAATAAANKMRFKPALRNGQPVDSTAIVHVVFQLAY